MIAATPDKVATAVKADTHAHPWPGAKDFAAYRADSGYQLLQACLDGRRTRDDIVKAWREDAGAWAASGKRGAKGMAVRLTAAADELVRRANLAGGVDTFRRVG
jgi:hypothetical protein